MKRGSVWTMMFLLALTSGCAGSGPKVVTIYRDVLLPETFLRPCQTVEWEGGSFRKVAALAERRGKALSDCNDQLARARQYQADRQKDAK